MRRLWVLLRGLPDWGMPGEQGSTNGNSEAARIGGSEVMDWFRENVGPEAVS